MASLFSVGWRGVNEKGLSALLDIPLAARDAAALYAPLTQAFLYMAAPLRSHKTGPVLLIPGYTATKSSIAPLHKFLRRQGHQTYDWKLGRNMGRSSAPIAEVGEVVKKISQQHDGAKVSLVGHSLGGVFAEAVAAKNPEHVSRIITSLSPIRRQFLLEGQDVTADTVRELFMETRFLEDGGAGALIDLLDEYREVKRDYGIPTTHIYTRSDRVIGPDSGYASVMTPETDNIEIDSSHIGLGFNPMAHYIIAHKLALPEGVADRFNYEAFPFIMPQAPYHEMDEAFEWHAVPEVQAV